MERLENAGFPTYAVGGCVRDALLGLTPHDYDLCTAATPAVTASLFPDHTLIRAGEKHGTIGVVVDGQVIEITTFRTEGEYRDSRHPEWVDFVTNIEEDLARRDFTVNAMAYSPTRGFADPFGGQTDLQNHVLRAVGQPAKRFTEDALRILRGIRFAARFSLTPEPATLDAMKSLAPLMDKLARERVFDELNKLLLCASAQNLLTFAPILAHAIPALGATVGLV
jgi:tRNA nucleotidyltransferase (CCA-adding enzyme)